MKENPIYTYKTDGYYNVCLTTINTHDVSNINCKEIGIGVTGSNNCSIDFYFITVGDSMVKFSEASYGSPDKFKWDFGDGKQSAERNPQNFYRNSGYYPVSLQIENTATGCKSSTVKLLNIGMSSSLKAYFKYIIRENTQKAGGYPVEFTSIASGPFSKLKWVFDDGGSDSTNTNPIHTYAELGKYNVCFTVSDPITSQSNTYCEEITNSHCLGDTIRPLAMCKNITVTLDKNGKANITPEMVDNGSTDNCGSINNYVINKSSFTTADLGMINVNLTITDLSNNTNSCKAVVTVQDYPDIQIPSSPTNLIATVSDIKVTLKWDQNSESNITYYRIYMGSFTTNAKLIDSAIDTSYIVNGLVSDKTYYFYVTAINSKGKESEPSNIVYTIPCAKPIIKPMANICPGDTGVLKVTNPYDSALYAWYEDGNRLNLKYSNEYQTIIFNRIYIVEDDYCGAVSDPVVIKWKASLPNDSFPKIYKGGGSKVYYFATEPYAKAYQWFCNGKEIPRATNYYYVADDEYYGIFYVKIPADNNNCPAFSPNDTLLKSEGQQSKSEVIDIDDVTIYPNPVGDVLNVTIHNPIIGNYYLNISDLSGRPVMHASVVKEELMVTTTIQVTNLASGYYVLGLQNNIDIGKKRVFIKK
jgi:PKD repeat protein